MKYFIIITIYCSAVLSNYLFSQIKEVSRPVIPTSSHKVFINTLKGIDIYLRKSDNHLLNNEYEIHETHLNKDTDIVNSYYFSGFYESGTFKKGHKNGLWKTVYKKNSEN